MADMNRVTITHLDVGSVASLPVRVPVVSFGSEPPILSILCGVHGDETASLMSVRRFMQLLQAEDSMEGTVRIITSANPLAQATRSRVTPSDFGNLNRTGKGKLKGRLTERLAHILFEFLRDSALVIDLHEFEMDTPTMALHIPSHRAATGRTILENIAVFEPDFVWAIPEDPTSLVGALIESGVAGFGVETSDAMVMTNEIIDDVAAGLYRVAQNLGILASTPSVSPVTAYETEIIKADQAGVWEPTSLIFAAVDETNLIGKIIPLPLLDEIPVRAPGTGRILQLARRRLVATGTNLFAIGQIDRQVTKGLRLAIPSL